MADSTMAVSDGKRSVWRRALFALWWLLIVLMGVFMVGVNAYIAYVLLKNAF